MYLEKWLWLTPPQKKNRKLPQMIAIHDSFGSGRIFWHGFLGSQRFGLRYTVVTTRRLESSSTSWSLCQAGSKFRRNNFFTIWKIPRTFYFLRPQKISTPLKKQLLLKGPGYPKDEEPIRLHRLKLDWWRLEVQLYGLIEKDVKRNGFWYIWMHVSKKSPTGPAERTPKPEYLIALAPHLGVRW